MAAQASNPAALNPAAAAAAAAAAAQAAAVATSQASATAGGKARSSMSLPMISGRYVRLTDYPIKENKEKQKSFDWVWQIFSSKTF